MDDIRSDTRVFWRLVVLRRAETSLSQLVARPGVSICPTFAKRFQNTPNLQICKFLVTLAYLPK